MPAVDGAEAPFRSGHSALVTLPDAKRRQALCTAHRSKWASTVTYWAICASASNFADTGRARHGRHRTSPALHVTRKTRSRRLAVAPLHHGAPVAPWSTTMRRV